MARRVLLYVWALAVVALAFAWNFPMSNRLSRLGTLALLGFVWAGGLALVWRYRIPRWAAIGASVATIAFLLRPSGSMVDSRILREAYVRHLPRYLGVRYIWGGESSNSIDCSGLVRRTMFDTLVGQGILHASPATVRAGLGIWWNDRTAAALAEASCPETKTLPDFAPIQARNAADLRPGDLAVTANGIHVLAHLGDGRWIDADPTAQEVRITSMAAADNPWFADPVRIVRWRWLVAGDRD